MGANIPTISDQVVDAWIAGMPRSTDEIIIVSLLGRKPNGLSEFSYYSFRGGFDKPEDRPGCPSWQEWLFHRYASKYRLQEFPTVDTEFIQNDIKKEAAKTVLGFMQLGKTVVVVDSGGIGRTGSVIAAIRKMGVGLSEQRVTQRAR
jgi:hypothetical protein